MHRKQLNGKAKSLIKLWRPDNNAYDLLCASGVTESMPRQISPNYMLGVVETGQAEIHYRDENYHINGSCFLLLHPNEPFTRLGNNQHPRTVRMLISSPDFLQQQLSEQTQVDTELPKLNLPYNKNKHIIDNFLRLHRLLEMPHSQLEGDSWLQEIIALIIKYCDAEPTDPPSSKQESQRIKKVRDILINQFSENISLNDLASLVNLSPYRLNRVFSREVGIPPHAFLNQVRVWQAKTLLEKNTPIAEVAINVGFYDQAHLTRHFKRIMGFTPGLLIPNKK